MMRHSRYYIKRQTTRIIYNRIIGIAVVSGLVASCAVVLVGPYDEVTDKAITDLAMKTEQFFVRMESGSGSYESNKSFYQDANASIRAIRLRAEPYEKNEGELRELDLLAGNLDNLAKLHRLGPLTGTAASIARTQIETNFKSLIQIELAKKRSSGVSAMTS